MFAVPFELGVDKFHFKIVLESLECIGLLSEAASQLVRVEMP